MMTAARQIDPSTEGPPDTSVAALTELPGEHDLKRGIIHTDVSRPVAWTMAGLFLALIFTLPLVQAAVELKRGERVQALDVFTRLPDRHLNREYEEELHRASVARETVQPWLQYGLTRWGGFGNVKTTVGRDGWLFYTPGVEYVAGPGFLDEDVMRLRRKKAMDEGHEPVHPDPRPAILQFRQDLAARGIRLVLVPVPDKATAHPDRLSGRVSLGEPLAVPQNPDIRRLSAGLQRSGVFVLDPSPMMVGAGEAPRFLVQDTHWTPRWMESVAGGIATFLRDTRLLPPPERPREFKTETRWVERVGDLVDMLQLPPGQTLFRPHSVSVRQVVGPDGGPWQPSRDAEVLLLGDSFTNIYSDPAMGWGESAGFAEHLSRLMGRGVDVIARNDNGAYATREALARDLARGRDRLAGKKIVVWQFAARELAHGNWKPIEMKLGAPPPSQFIVPDPGKQLVVTGTVESRSGVSRPGTVPYKDQVFALHLTDLESGGAPIPGGQSVVYLWGMRDNVWTPAARLRVGQRVTLRLRNWSDVASQYERINRSELADEALQFEDPAWGELVE